MPPHLHHIRGTTLERAPANAEGFGGLVLFWLLLTQEILFQELLHTFQPYVRLYKCVYSWSRARFGHIRKAQMCRLGSG